MATNTSQQSTTPFVLKDPALMISAAPAFLGMIPTIFVGKVDNNYTNARWQEDSARMGITALFIEIKVRGIGTDEVDTDQLDPEVEDAVQCINRQPFETIRIVCLGNRSSKTVIRALEIIIQRWRVPPEKRDIQYVVFGDSDDRHYFNFCKMLCINGLCKQVQYCDAMDYNERGEFSGSIETFFHGFNQFTGESIKHTTRQLNCTGKTTDGFVLKAYNCFVNSLALDIKSKT